MSEIVEKAEKYVSDLLQDELDTKFLYHNLRHTQRVVKSTKELLNYYNLDTAENEKLLLAAWFHDTGYTKGVKTHEKNSCGIARDFLDAQQYPSEQSKTICDIIMATQRHYEPQNLNEQIIRDADASHFAQKSYWETTDFLKEELSLLGLMDFTAKEWRDENIKMFRNEHRFYTDYAQENWQEGKEKNLKQLVKEKKTEIEIAKIEAL
ncbi:MAG: HD domain-containing protein, partial [Bacteroidota bacterium]